MADKGTGVSQVYIKGNLSNVAEEIFIFRKMDFLHQYCRNDTLDDPVLSYSGIEQAFSGRNGAGYGIHVDQYFQLCSRFRLHLSILYQPQKNTGYKFN